MKKTNYQLRKELSEIKSQISLVSALTSFPFAGMDKQGARFLLEFEKLCKMSDVKVLIVSPAVLEGLISGDTK